MNKEGKIRLSYVLGISFIFILFFLMSLAVYRSTGLSFKWADEVRKGLSGTEIAKLGYFEERLQSDRDYKIGAHTLSSVRVKTTFRSYYLQREEQKLNEVLGRKEELSLEYALSQIFSPKQKELFLKKLKGEKFSKTEKEYFSRTVKKKVTALSNQELHRLARQLLS